MIVNDAYINTIKSDKLHFLWYEDDECVSLLCADERGKNFSIFIGIDSIFVGNSGERMPT